MHTHKPSKIFKCDTHTLAVLLCTAGLTLGIFAGGFISDPLAVALRNLCNAHSVLLVPSAVLPITLVWFASKYAMGGLVYMILFGKAFLDGVIFFAMGCSFGSAAWLMGVPILLSDRFGTVVFLYYSCRCLEDKNYRCQLWYFVFMLLIIGLILFDYYLISPNFINFT